jgi:hypothetical protein
VMYSLMPNKTYMEMAIPAQNKMTTSKTIKGEITRVKKGNDKINGYDCEKYLVTYRDSTNGKTTSVYQWLSSQVIIPVKTMAPDGSWASELKKITKGSIDPSKFEVPAGYKKFSMPMGPGGRMPMKGMPKMKDLQKMFQ